MTEVTDPKLVEPAFEWRGRVIQDGVPVASVTAGSKKDMLRELGHYAAVYEQDGPIMLETRTGKNRWRRLIP